MHTQAVHAESGILHQHFGPVFIRVAGSAGDFVQLVFPVLPAEVLIPPVFVRVVFRPHQAAAAPALVAHAPEAHAPAVLLTVLPAFPYHRGIPVAVQVFHPFAHFPYRSAAHVSRDIGLAPHLPAQFQEFMGSEGVVLRHPAPVGVDHHFPVLLRSDAIPPVVFIREASARPAQHGHVQCFHGFHHVLAHPVHVGNPAVLPHEDPAVDAPAEMLREMAVDVPGNRSLRPVPVNADLCHLFSPLSL